MKKNLNIFVSAGESSGDLHASQVIRLLKKESFFQERDLKIWGLGLSRLQSEKVEIIQEMSKLGIIGISGLIKNLLFFLELEKKIVKELKERKPDFALLVDYPGLNLRLAEQIKKNYPACKVLFYVAPQVWAWHQSRKYKLAKVVDRLYPILPFEEELYSQAGTKALYLGNPSCYQSYLFSQTFKRKEFLESLKIDPKKTIITLCPGSRKRTCDFILPVLLEAAKALQKKNKQVQFLLIKASSISKEQLEFYFRKAELSLDSCLIKIIDDQDNFEALASATISWTVSGTVTLEAACLQTPMILGNRENSFYAWFFRTFIRINLPGLQNSKLIGLPNLIAAEQISPELFQKEFRVENFLKITQEWLSKPEILEQTKKNFQEKVIKKLKPRLDPSQGIVNELKSFILESEKKQENPLLISN